MRAKSARSLEAAQILFASGLFDDAASRSYYALFQAGVHGLEAQGRKPQDFRSTYWDHLTVARFAPVVRGRAEDAALFDEARLLRQNADYKPGFLQRRWIEFLRRDVEQFVIDVTR